MTCSVRTERQAFVRLGVFVGGCTLEAAEGVCDVTLDSLGALVDNNLLRRRDSRFLMLETVCHFAVERLEEAGSAELRRRHAEWLTELAETMADRTTAGEDAAEWLDRIQPEHGNIRAALSWSVEEAPELALETGELAAPLLGGPWPRRRRRPLARAGASERCRRAAGGAEEGALRRAEPSPFASATSSLRSERWDAALALARELGDDLWIARLLCDRRCGRGGAGGMGRRNDPARGERGAFPSSSTNPPDSRRCSATSVTSRAERGDYARAIAVTEEALSLESSHKPNAALSTYNLGSHNLEAGNVDRARELLERAVVLTLELGYKEVMAYALASLARICLLDGDPARAAHLAGVADRLLVDAGDRPPGRRAGAVRRGQGDSWRQSSARSSLRARRRDGRAARGRAPRRAASSRRPPLALGSGR